MTVIKQAIARPIAVVSSVLMVILFGLVALEQIPIQLAPDVDRPVITVNTVWPGAAPIEVEREIVNKQEEQLAGVEGLHTISSSSQQGSASVTLEFDINTNMEKALLLVSNRLDRVDSYPQEVDLPTLDTAGSEDNAIAWFIITRENNNERPIHEYGDFVNDVIKNQLERIAGVSEVSVYGGSDSEIQITVRPETLAQYKLTVTEVVNRLRQASASITGGDIDEGKRRYIVRTEGELNTLDAVREVVLRTDINQTTGRRGRVLLGDIADVTVGYKEPTSRIRFLGQPAIAFNAKRQTGANVIETMQGIRQAVLELNKFSVPNAGLVLEQVYDETGYIDSAIQLVKQNIWIGGTLAALILLLFLRSIRATLIISIAIPVSVIGAFVAMAALGRSLNVISLAGLAFAVGMVVDAAIVVLENIYRHREHGSSASKAAYHGTEQVWGAVLVSALTTVMVFIPILALQLEVGQLFRDIAVAISVSVMLSLVVSITVIPALANYIFASKNSFSTGKRLHLPIIDSAAKTFVSFVLYTTENILKSRFKSLLVVVTVTAFAVAVTWLFLPKLEYLPEGNRNLVFGVVLPPPGYNLKTITEIAENVENATRPHWSSETGRASKPGEPPKIQRFFFVATNGITFLGAASEEPERAGELIPVLSEPVFSEPGTYGFVSQPSIFGRGVGSGRKIDLDIAGSDLESILQVAVRSVSKLAVSMPISEGNQYRPRPGLELGAPEVRLFPDRIRLADNGISTTELGNSIDAFNDGLRVIEVTSGSKRLDLTLRGPENHVTQTQGIGALPVVTSDGRIIPTASLAKITVTSGPTELRHRERLRTVTLEIRPAPNVPLEAALDTVRDTIIKPLQQEGLPNGITFSLSGTAEELDKTWNAMSTQLQLALIIVYLVMAVLFESFLYPCIIMLSVPVAAAGGVAGLALLNRFTFQPLDMLTLLGFVILIGIVVNNAILLVHQSLHHLREDDMDAISAIKRATANRIRPIFMSTLTSVFGMLPLVFFPGAGSELYRGLGSVVVGGLALSAILTLLIVPPMLNLIVAPIESRRLARQQNRLADSS